MDFMSIVTPDPKRRALGKGLDSLLPRPASKVADSTQDAESEGGKPREISVDLIDPNPFQTRSTMDESQLSELAASITANGVVQPILVRPQANGRYQLIAGERRWRASMQAGKKTIPAILRQVSDEQAMEITIVENLQRADLNPMEQARAFERLGREFHMTQEQIALRTGKDRATVGNFIRLLRLPTTTQKLVEEGELSFGHAKALLALGDERAIEDAARTWSVRRFTVRQLEEWVKARLNPVKRQKVVTPAVEEDPNVREVREQLQQALGLRVQIEDNKGRGRVIIEYLRLEDFDALLDQLAGPHRK
jgi:ParB family chromosome partitioning protein